MFRYILLLIVFLLFVWRIKRGFANGIMGEIVTIISGIISLVCVALIFFAVTSAKVKAMSTLTVCIIGLILLGIVFRICSLIFAPLLALSNISFIEGLNKMLGAVLGALEACILTGLLYYILDYAGMHIL
ncbi:MAG: hypothetical protein K2O13_01560 [Lachnospiraceae bacterium]|nr:hypothetical protein [Lachnospiraceae bacterium]